MITKEQITSLTEESLSGTDRFVVDVKVKSGNRIMVFIDADSSIDIDSCIQVSRFIEDHLDRDVEDFELEVSSAGIDSPLKLTRQYQKNIGNDLIIKMKDGDKLRGKLVGFNQQSIQIEPYLTKKEARQKKEGENAALNIDFEQIEEVKPEIKF